jgi:GxxExxY protein
MLLHQEITDKILKCYYNVYNALGYGFLEKVYENSLRIELIENNLSVKQQVQIPVYYKEQNVGNYFADLLVDNKIILELKACESIVE